MRFESWKLYNVRLNLEIQIRQSDIRIILLILNAWAPYPVWALLIFRINAWFLHFSYPYSVWPIFWKKNRKRLKKFILERFPFFWGPIPCWGVTIAAPLNEGCIFLRIYQKLFLIIWKGGKKNEKLDIESSSFF